MGTKAVCETHAEAQQAIDAYQDAYPQRHAARTSAMAALRVAQQSRIDKKTVTICLEDLHEYLQTHHLRTVGGDPDLPDGDNDMYNTVGPWKPKVFVVAGGAK
jgi:hypothetical protein